MKTGMKGGDFCFGFVDLKLCEYTNERTKHPKDMPIWSAGEKRRYVWRRVLRHMSLEEGSEAVSEEGIP